jgi:hypothetical protein
MRLTLSVLLLARPGRSGPASPTRLRADGTDWATVGPHKLALPSTARPLFTWAPGSSASAFSLRMADSSGRVVWDSGKTLSSRPSWRYPHTAPTLHPGATYTWRVVSYDASGTPSAAASAALHVALAPSNWTEVAWLGDAQLNVYATAFTAPPSATRVTLYVCGLGFSVVRVNGAQLNILTTAPWTNNAEVNGFSALDLTQYLMPARRSADAAMTVDENHLVISLGNGWRDRGPFPVGDGDDTKFDGAHPRMLRAKVVATLADGSLQTLSHTGDASWTAAVGPSTADSVYNGEVCVAPFAHSHGLSPLHPFSVPPLLTLACASGRRTMLVSLPRSLRWVVTLRSQRSRLRALGNRHPWCMGRAVSWCRGLCRPCKFLKLWHLWTSRHRDLGCLLLTLASASLVSSA